MSCFLGEIVRWTLGDEYALVKPRLRIEDGFTRTITPRETELEFLGSGKAIWFRPISRCQVGRWVLFEKGTLAEPHKDLKQFQIRPIGPKIIIREEQAGVTNTQVSERILDLMAAYLTSRGATRIAQDFRVYLKRGKEFLDYFGPFEKKGPHFVPPPNPRTVKRYRVLDSDLPTLLLPLDGQELEILQPLRELTRVEDDSVNRLVHRVLVPAMAVESMIPVAVHSLDPGPPDLPILLPSPEPPLQQRLFPNGTAPTLSDALENLEKALPVLSLRHDLETLGKALTQAKDLTREELDLIKEMALQGLELGEELQKLLPVLREHVDFSELFEKELEAHKERLESGIEAEIERRLETTIKGIIQEERELAEAIQAPMEKQEEVTSWAASPLVAPNTPVEETAAPVPKATGMPPLVTTSQAAAHPIALKDAQAVLKGHIPLARLQTAWSVKRIPLLCGPRSLGLAKAYADLICGGSLRWTSIDPLLTRVRDLIGTFEGGLFRPHPSGIAALLARGASGAVHPSVVVFEGANRVPLELLLEPLVHSRDTGLPLFAVEAFRPEDPWAALGGLPWPPLVLIACTLTAGVSKQPISKVLWDRLMVVDEAPWPKNGVATIEPSFLPAADYSQLSKPAKGLEGKTEIQEFEEEVKEALWASPGALKVIQHLDGLEVPDPVAEVQTLILAAGAICAGADIQSMKVVLKAPELKRLERLLPFLD